MHELSIATAILDRVQAEAHRHQAHICKVGVRVGEISGVDPEALAFGFEVLVKDTDFEPLALIIETCPRVQRCCGCAHEFVAADSDTVCPKCGNAITVCVGGDELDIAFMETEDQ